MKNAKRWLAILLAVTLLCSNGVSQLGMIVSASELETTEEVQPKEDAVVEQAEETKEDTGKATVEGVTPEEERGESSAQDAETANVPKAAAQEGQNEANVPEAAPATVAPTTATPATVTPATAVPASEGAGQQGEATAPEVQTYNVKINKSELDGGQIKAWGSDNNKVDVTEYDGNNQYVKEVKEGEEFNFQITLNDGFEIAQVKVNGNAFDPANTEGNVITYKVAGINEEKVIDVTYNKVETPAEKKAAEESKTEDETKVEEPAVEDSTATAEMEDNSINTASLNENISTVAEHKDTETEKWIKINDKVTLSNSYSPNWYIHNWNVEDNEVATVSGSRNIVKVTGKKVGKTKVTDTVSTWRGTIEIIEYTIHVTPNVVATNITISGPDTVTQFKTTQLTASFTPEDADGTVSWSSSNDEILTVNDSGLVTGNRLGTATVTASVQGKDNKTLSATKEVTVVKNENTADSNIVEASVYYLGDPNNDPNSNDTGHWGDEYGVATVNIEGATWKNNKNCFDNVDQRVVSWPNGSNVILTGTTAWNTIYENYKTTIESQFKGLKFEKDDVEEISLVPVKISKDNRVDEYSSRAVHLDCRVNIKCKNIALVKYFLFDVGGAGYVQKGSQNYIINDSAITDPTSVTGEDFPQTKTVSGVTYTFSGWYTDQSLTTPAPVFPAKVTGSVDYYAKYVAGYYVTYDLQGGTFSDGSSLSEKYNVDTTVTVKSNPTRAGYRFTGWKVEGLGTTTSLNSGDTFIMPDNSVKLTAQWEEQKIEDFITLTPANVTKVYNGRVYAAGEAKVVGKDEGADTASVKIEYSLNGTGWTTNPSEITATNVSDSKTVQVRATSEKYTGELTGTENLTITKRPITITGDGWTSDQPYKGNEYKKTTYTVEEANAENTSGLVAGQTAEVTYELKGTNVGNYTGTFGTTVIKKGEEDVTANYTVTKTPGTLTITKAEIAQYVTLTPVNVTKVYDGNTYAAGTARTEDTNGNDLKIEYQKADGSWTEDPSEITATNVSDSTTVNVRVSSEGNYDGYVTGTEELKITARPITITGDGWTSDQPYTGSEYQTTIYTVEEANAENTRGLVAGQTAEVTYELKGTNVGNYTGTFGTAVIKNGEEDVTANYTVTKTPGTLKIIKSAIENYINIYPVDVTEVYDGEAHVAGIARATDRNGNTLKIEYSVNGTDWTENSSEITATNVSDSTIVNVRVSTENYAGYVTGTEKLTITPKPVTVTANDLNKTYKEIDPELTATVTGTLGEDILTYDLSRVVGEDVGKYPITASGEGLQGNYNVTYNPGTLTITAATRTTALSVTSYEGTYDAEKHAITVNGTVAGDKVEYSYDSGKTWGETPKEYKDVTNVAIQVKVTNKNYKPEETILNATVIITPATLTVSTPIATKVYEGTPLTAAGTISGFVNDETATFATTGSQTEVGSTANTYSLTWDGTAKESNYKVVETIGTLTVTAQSIDPENPDYKGITVDAPTDVEYTGEDQTWLPTVTDGNGKALVKDTDYTVTYDNEDRTNVTGIITVTINGAGNYAGTITRTYQITPKPVTITTESKTKAFDGTALTAGGKVEGIVSGETYGFKITGSQTYVGSSQNTYEMVWADSEVEGTSGTYTAKKTNYTVTESIGTLAVTAGTPENPLDPTLVVNKTHDKSQTYKAGDVITFTITAKNIYEEAKTITLEELEGVALDANVFENVAPGAEVTATATYTVTEQDIVNGTFTNNVTVTFSGVDDKLTGTDTVDEFEDAKPHMTITKTTVGAEEGHIYKLGEVINYKITATNDGNLTLTNVKVEDALTGNVGENAFTIDTLAPGEAQTFDVRYVVTENDVLEGKVINNATGTATDPTDPDEPKTPVTPGEKEDPIETPNPSLAVVKTSDKTGVVKLGETITYTITVTNNGNVTINDIEVTDELTGNTGDNAFTIDRLAVGETKQFTATYTVTEDDILEGTIVNRATATGKDPRNEEVTGEGEVRVDTEEKDDSKKDDSKKNDSDKKPGAVKTGDATDVIPFFGMTVLAAGAAIVIALKKKRRA